MSSRSRWVVAVALLAASAAGCQGKQFVRDQSVAVDPPIVPADPVVTEPPPVDPGRVSLVDRHPVLRKPAEYYERSGPSPLRKMAAATFIGVPAGILGEIRQIALGAPPRY